MNDTDTMIPMRVSRRLRASIQRLRSRRISRSQQYGEIIDHPFHPKTSTSDRVLAASCAFLSATVWDSVAHLPALAARRVQDSLRRGP